MLLLLTAVAGCGRIAFGERADGGGSGSDTGSTADAPGNAVCGFRERPTLAMGAQTTCAVRLDGTLWCTGGSFGSRFQRVGTSDRYLRVDGEENHFCTLDVDCELECFGDNSAGELGLGDTLPRATPTAVTPGVRYRDIGAGGFHTCAIREDLALLCWGNNFEGALGLGDMMNRNVPTRVGNGAWKRLARGYKFHCAFDSADVAWCWGENDSGQLGIGAAAVGANQLAPVQLTVSTMAPWIQIASGKQHACALDVNRKLSCWGLNMMGQVGRGDFASPIPRPERVGPDVEWDQVIAGRFTSCALRPDRSLWCWGDNAFGAVGVRGMTNHAQPVNVATPAAWSALSPMNVASCAFDAAGDLYCWGENDVGQLGLGDTQTRFVPTKVTFP